MNLNSRLVSFGLALLVASISVAFISLLREATILVLLVAFSISFSAAFLLFYITLEFLILGEIHEAYAMLAKLKKKDFKLQRKKDITNISPIKRLNEQIYAYAARKQEEIDHLRQMNAYRREFLADVSHELKTPIFAAQGYLHTLLDGAVDDVEVRDKFLKKAARSLDGLNELVQDLFTLSQMEAGMIRMNLQVCDLISLAKEVLEQMEHAAERRNITPHLHTTPEHTTEAYIYADPNHIKRVLINLVENGIKYGKEGGNVWVNIESKTKNFAITVADDGIGIPEEHLDRIFERFYRVEKSRSKAKGGSGLGLAIVKHIIEAHNARITVQSVVQQGTTFRFKLRKVRDEGVGEASEANMEEAFDD